MCRVTDNMGLVYSEANKINLTEKLRKLLDYDDLVGIGSYGLVKADKNYKQSDEVKFSTYACTCIRNELLMAIRKEKKNPIIESIEKPITCSNCGKKLLTLKDILTDNSESIISKLEKTISKRELKEEIKNKIETLKPIQQYCVLHFYGLFKYTKLNQKQIAENLNISQPAVSKRLKSSRKELMLHINREVL